MSKLHIKKGDTVYVNSGEDKGKTGRVLKVLVKEGRALVEGINMVSKSTKPNAKNPQGGIVKQEAAIHISNLNVVDPKTGKPTRVGRKESSDGRTFVRYAKKSGEDVYKRQVLTEPIMKLEVVTPEENRGDVIGDLNKRRGQVEGMESSRSGARIVKAKVPLAEMFGYVTALRTITSGRATSSMTYDHHAQVSSSIAKAVLEEVKGRVDLV